MEENSRDLLAERFPEKFAEMKYFYSFVLTDVLDLLEHGLKTGKICRLNMRLVLHFKWL